MRRFIIEAIAQQSARDNPDGSLSMAVAGATVTSQPPIVTAMTYGFENVMVNGVPIAGQLANGTTLCFRLTCLNCGLITEALYHAMQRHLIDHACEDRDEPHWHQVVRDAVIEGRDRDIVRLIASELGLLAGE